ncbi:MAG: S53 family peptidase [Micrococcales bacterium]|nr:S53 family peptidase [Micrococcales bacterium]
MPSESTPLPGSNRDLPDAAAIIGRADRTEPIHVTLVLRRRGPLPDPATRSSTAARITHEELAARYGADPADIAVVTDVVTRAGATVVQTDAASRRVRVSGTVATLESLFGTSLHRARLAGDTAREARVRSGGLSVPAKLDGIVTAILGLDERPAARVPFRPVTPVPAAGGISYTPPELARIYQMPPHTDGAGTTLAIIELGGGFRESDLAHYFTSLGIAMPDIRAVGVDGATNTPGTDPNSADGEVVLDIEVAGAIAPGAHQLVYFAPNTDAGFLDAVSAAAHATPAPTALSISWGESEDSWTAQARTAMDEAFADAVALGVTVTAAAGDNGSSDSRTSARGVHVDFPASSPHVLACGGTSLHADAQTGEVTSETVWNDGPGRGATGGGISDAFAQPPWQLDAGVPTAKRHRRGHPTGARGGRGVPDVAANADPATGYQVYVDGTDAVFGGTSAVAPLWAALVCRCAQSLGHPLGLLQPVLYRGIAPGVGQPGFRDITTGSNGAYAATTGWDPCTGLGVPIGTALLSVLRD